MSKKQYGIWEPGYHTVQAMVDNLQAALLDNGLSLNQFSGQVVIKYVRRPPTSDGREFTAIKVEYDNEQAS